MANRPCNGGHLSPFLALYRQGVRLFHIDATCSEDIYHPELRAWIAPGQFNYSAQEEYWRALLVQCPDARLCLRLYVGSPPWWDEAHVAELQRYSDNRVEHSFQRSDRKTLPSLASEIWQSDAVHSLEHFLAWLESSGWAAKVWGLFLCYGITWEWGILGSDDFLDYSEPMRQRFRLWLHENYPTEIELQNSWNAPGKTFESAKVPTREARLHGEGDFRQFPRDRAAYDFQRCLSEVNSDYLLRLARTVRNKVGRRYMIGAFYGYTLTAREHSESMGRIGSGGLQGGHHAFARVLSARLFDFFSSPFAYSNRSLYDGLLVQHIPLSSVQARGIHYYDENDLWSYTNRPPQFEGQISVGSSQTLEESIAHQRLALAQALCRGTSYWWTELTDWVGPYGENFSDPALLNELKRHVEHFARLGGESVSQNNSAAQIALIVDESAVDALTLNSKLFVREIYAQLASWAWCGAPFDVWLASDVTEQNMRPYRLVYVFAPYLKEDRRIRLADTFCRDERTVWWGPYAGWLTDRGGDVAAFAALTGFADPVYENGTPRVLNCGKWTALYGGCAGLTAQQLGQIAQRAGVHMYGEAPVQIMASQHLICVHVGRGGEYRLRLPRHLKWRDIFSTKILEDSTFDFPSGGVALFAHE